MYSKQIVALLGLSVTLFASCRSSHTAKFTAPVLTQPVPTAAVNNNNAKAAATDCPITKNVVHTRDSNAVAKKPVPKIIEKGGRYIMIPPAYMRLKPETGAEQYNPKILQQKMDILKKYAAKHHYNNQLAFFVDMHVKSNHNRFFIINLKTGNIIKQGLVAHGRGNEKFTFNHSYSNGSGTNCTSLGIYKIGKGYTGAFGLSYKLFGLEKSNSNALKRYVVLHAMGAIPEEESKYPIIQSEGCPAVAPAFLSQLAPVLDHANKNILLYIYDSSKA